ncbi:PucR family transcriptional regulator [Cohnella herbarum]|uniref:PucR family transcriptional regulator n=1 Tax=Cohnella herbarum TaxID=2728023 RepID=A0A7Z2VMF2_9BACL|nr:PucR family transcriptional regulator [Cohnella herbarum]QJD85768.1 PucR family transcriptional regulator [Cohnella herbarum]
MDDPIREGFTVKSLFDVPQFKDAVLLGGEAGLNSLISRINVMEVPDVIDWVRPGELLMTTGYPFKHDPEVLVPLIEQLASKGVAALGVKTKRFFDEVPAAAIEAANRYGMPLIELPPGTTFSDVVREVMERVLVSESKDLTILQGRVQRLSHVLLHGDGLSSYLNHLQVMIRNPVILLDPHNRRTGSPDAEKLFELIEETEWVKFREDQTPETNVLQIGERSVRVHVATVPDGQVRSYLLLILEYSAEYGAVDTLTINWAGRLLGFEISNMQARKNIEVKYFDQFLQDWLAGRIVSTVDLRLRAEACGWPLAEDAVYLAGVVSFWERKPEVKSLQELAKRLNWESDSRGSDLKWTVLEGELVVLFTLRSEEIGGLHARQQLTGNLWTILRPMIQEKQVSLCLGREVSRQAEVSGSYRDAKRAADIRRVCRLKDETLRYNELGVYLLLYRLQGTDEMEEFQRLYLNPLLELDAKQQGALLNTLRTYFDCNCNAKETAERMYLHYNTINYRLDRIKNELGLRLDDPETKLLLQLAIRSNDIE